MARGPNRFKQRDLTRALRGAKAAGIEVGRVEIDQAGKISVVIGPPKASSDLATPETPETLRELL